MHHDASEFGLQIKASSKQSAEKAVLEVQKEVRRYSAIHFSVTIIR